MKTSGTGRLNSAMNEQNSELEDVYAWRSQETLAFWQRNPANSKDVAPHFYSDHLKSLTVGTKPDNVASSISRLLDDLRKATEGDALADNILANNFHYTLLSVTPCLYKSREDIQGLNEVSELFNSLLSGHRLTITDLRLIPLPNQLLLAGIPSPESSERRKLLWDNLQGSFQKTLLAERYPGRNGPPVYWHSTLLRYRSETLPEYLRQFFTERMNERYGSVSGEARLVLVTYDWSEVDTIG